MVIFEKTLASVESPYNGRLKVVKSLAWGTYIQAEGLTQSGGVVESIWKKVLGKLKKRNLDIKNCLILGLGGGTVAKLLNSTWTQAKIYGVDIDPFMVSLGEKYLGLDRKKVKIKVADALDFVLNELKGRKKYDLIVVDLYCGSKFPEKFSSDKFLKLVSKIISKGGVVLFNRLYTSDLKTRKSALFLGRKLERFFDEVEYFYPQANLVFICSKPSIHL